MPVYRTGRNIYRIFLEVDRDPATGKRRQSTMTFRGTRPEAEAEYARLRNQRAQGIELGGEKLRVADYLDRWLRDYASVNTKPRTEKGYRQIIDGHVKPVVGSMPLGKLRPLHIQRIISTALGTGVSKKTAQNIYRCLFESLRHAVKWELIGRNPAEAIDPPRPPRFQAPALGVDDVERLMEAADAAGIGALVKTAVMTGLRQGEVLRLRWEDVDLDRGALAVRESKSAAGVRAIALSPATVVLLRKHRRQQAEDRLRAGPAWHDETLVFATTLGTPIQTIRRSWAKVVKLSGVRVRFHDLRHAHATLMLKQGIHPKIVQERLGHSRIEVTLNTYSHVLPGLQAEAAAALDRVLPVTHRLHIADEGKQKKGGN